MTSYEMVWETLAFTGTGETQASMHIYANPVEAVVVDENTATSCPFCNNPVLWLANYPVFYVRFVIPFKLDKRLQRRPYEAFAWQRLRRKFLKIRTGLKKSRHLCSFWLFDAGTDDIRYRATKVAPGDDYIYTRPLFFSFAVVVSVLKESQWTVPQRCLMI